MSGSNIAQCCESTTLVSFASQGFRHQQIFLSKSAINVGIDYIASWNEERLRREVFYTDHRHIFARKIGLGCWLWKPYIIYNELLRLPYGSVLIYWDVGKTTYPHRFEQSPQPLISWCIEETDGILPGVYIPQYGPNKYWTKRDCFVAMGCDSPKFWNHVQVQATFSIWQKNPKALAFIEEWLSWCQRSEVITDEQNRFGLPNCEGFVAHRHDQSVLTNLVVKHQLKCFGDPSTSLPGDKDINNLVDRVLGQENRIRRREFRKRWTIRKSKVTDPAWWRRNMQKGIVFILRSGFHETVS